MRVLVPLAFALGIAQPVAAETLVAAATIRPETVIAPHHLARAADPTPGALEEPSDAIGLEARVAIYAGRPIRPGDLGPPAVIERNQIVPLVFHQSGLAIQTEGRSLQRAAAGETVRALNLASRNTVTGVVDETGTIHVAP